MVDASGNPITDPETADRAYRSGCNYSMFVGYFAVGPGNNPVAKVLGPFASLTTTELDLTTQTTQPDMPERLLELRKRTMAGNPPRMKDGSCYTLHHLKLLTHESERVEATVSWHFEAKKAGEQVDLNASSDPHHASYRLTHDLLTGLSKHTDYELIEKLGYGPLSSLTENAKVLVPELHTRLVAMFPENAFGPKHPHERGHPGVITSLRTAFRKVLTLRTRVTAMQWVAASRRLRARETARPSASSQSRSAPRSTVA